ncbi:hypothetical protein BSLG_004219 [Batrachochytrium salamandrivorans]|nr:hypothetical protein BSLG_004219 [Batrachochytrium salamandrivorans]
MLGVNNSHCSNIRHTASIARPSNTAEMLCNEIGGIFSTLPLELSQFTNIKYLIGSITCGVSSNRQGIDAFSNRLTMLFLSLKQHRPTASVDVYISDVVALISSVERFFVGHSAKNQLRQSLFTHAVSEQLETFDTIMMTLAKHMQFGVSHLIAFDHKYHSRSYKHEASYSFVEPTVHLASQLDIKTSPVHLFMETLSDISSFNIDIFPPDIAELLQGLLCRVADQIKQRTGRSLSERKRWSIDSGEISEALQEAVNDYRIQTRSYKAIWNGHEVVVNPIWGINNLESAITAAIYTNLESFLKLSAGIDSTARSKYVISISNGMKILAYAATAYSTRLSEGCQCSYRARFSFLGLACHRNQFSPQCTDHIRWMAPERYAHDYISSPALDVFAFAMTCYEIYTGLIPFYEQPNKHIVQEMAPFREIQSGGHSTLQISPFLHSSKSSDFSQKLDFRNDGFNSSPQAEATEIARLCQDRPKNSRMKGGTIEQESTTNGIEANRQSNKILNYANIVKVSTSSNAPTSSSGSAHDIAKMQFYLTSILCLIQYRAAAATPSVASELAIYTKEFHVLNVAFPFWIQNRFPLSNINRLLHSSIFRLTNLSELALHRSGLNGQIPKDICRLVNLKRLDLGANCFDGSIPKEIGLLVKLEQLSLHKNSFSDSIPKEFGSLVEMKWLRLDHNKLSGKIPKEIGNMTKLIQLCIDGNVMSRDIPAQIFEISNLREFRYDSDKSAKR